MKPIQRTDSLDHVKVLPNGTKVVYESAAGGMRKICCPKCGAANAVPSATAKGQQVLRCNCGAQFTSTRM